jgi:hypothetical protein
MQVAAMASPLTPLHHALNISEKHNYDSRHSEGWIGKRACLVTIDNGASLTITAGLFEKELPADNWGDPILKETFVKHSVGWHPLTD